MSKKPARASRSLTNTYNPNAPPPSHRLNLGSNKAMLEHLRGVVTSEHVLRRLGVSKQYLDGVLLLDPHEVLAAYDAKLAAAPVVMTGPAAPPLPPRAIKPVREIRSPRPRSRGG